MLVGVISDTHDNMPMIGAAADLFKERNVEAIVHAGDWVAPFALDVLLDAGIPLIGVLGNNDGEKRGLLERCAGLHDGPRRFELGGRSVALAHAEAQLGGVADGADLLVCGHSHRPEVRRGRSLLINPGEACGWLTGRCTVALLWLDEMRTEIVELGSAETLQI